MVRGCKIKMLSDEESEAKLELNRYIYGKNLSKDEIVHYLSIIFGLINKQSKEIEELNKSDESKEQSSMKYYNLYRELVEKIKEKIEEVKDGTYDAKIVLQSLLEKE